MRSKILLRVIVAVTLALLLGIGLSLLAFNYIYISSAKENLRSSSRFIIGAVEKMTSRTELEEFVAAQSGGMTEITVLDSRFRLIADTDAENLKPEVYEAAAYRKKLLDEGEFMNLGMPYRGKDSMVLYSVRVDNGLLDEQGFVVVRVSDFVFYNSMPFWYAIIAGGCIWIFLVLLMSFSVNSAVNDAIAPLSEVENAMAQISEGRYVMPAYEAQTVPELESFYHKLNAIGRQIAENVRELRYEQRKSQFLLESISQGILAISKNGTVMMNNKAVLDIFGRSNVVGLPVYTLFDDEALNEGIRRGLEKKEYRLGIFRKEGFVYRVEALAATMWGEETGEVSMLLILTNITQETNNSAIRSEFFANASHELKTPLTAISGYSELLQQPMTEQQSKRCAAEIYDNAARMKALIDDMLRLSKLDAQQDAEEISVVDLREICDAVVKEQKVIADKRNVTLAVTGAARIAGKRNMLTVMVTNLVNNAIKYNKEGGSVDLSLGEEPGSAVLTIADTGVGVAPKYQARLFERFFKVDAARRRSGESSTGLGLAIVKKIVSEHNATIELASVPNEGTTIKINFQKLE